MFFNILLIAVFLGVIEVMILVRLAETITISTTILLCLATAGLGSWLAKRKGLYILSKIQEELKDGEMPKDRIIDGIIVLLAGFTLLFPGFITDIAGFMLLIPGNRRMLREATKRHFRRKFVNLS